MCSICWQILYRGTKPSLVPLSLTFQSENVHSKIPFLNCVYKWVIPSSSTAVLPTLGQKVFRLLIQKWLKENLGEITGNDTVNNPHTDLQIDVCRHSTYVLVNLETFLSYLIFRSLLMAFWSR